MSRLVLALHDPWMALCLATARPGIPVATFGEAPDRRRLEALSPRVVVVPPPAEPSTRALLADPAVAALVAEETSLLLSFKPSRRLEHAALALGAAYALAPAALSAGLENKLALQQLARDAGVLAPRQRPVRLEGSWEDVAPGLSRPLVLQSPRGQSGKRTWLVEDAAGWAALLADLGGRPARASEWVSGQPGTVNAVVDRHGAVVVTAPMVQLTGIPWLTPHPLGSCGDDFTWRPSPHPGEGPAILAERLGVELARRGYRGQFGVDFVLGPDGPSLIEINPRLTASFALYSAWVPDLLDAHLRAVAGEALEPRRLPPVEGGQLIAMGLDGGASDPLKGDALPPNGLRGETTWPGRGERRGTRVVRGPVVGAGGELLTPWRPRGPIKPRR